MKLKTLIIVITLLFFCQSAYTDENEESTLAKVGMEAPDFTCRTVTGENFSLQKEKGKVILINFFATWCGPCQAELPHLEKQIYQKLKDRKDFCLIAIGREHNAPELEKFRKEKGLSFPIAPDPGRKIYGKYAEKFIPRGFIIGKDGKIKLASNGYSRSDFQEIVRTIRKELEK
jgi:peroxiredoxin